MNGHGPNASSFGEFWQRGGLGYKNVSYNIGPSPPSLTINLVNEQNYTITPAWNTIGIINGSISDEVVVLGNHRDAWIVGGAGDPNSGSTALNEVVRSFGEALSKVSVVTKSFNRQTLEDLQRTAVENDYEQAVMPNACLLKSLVITSPVLFCSLADIGLIGLEASTHHCIRILGRRGVWACWFYRMG